MVGAVRLVWPCAVAGFVDIAAFPSRVGGSQRRVFICWPAHRSKCCSKATLRGPSGSEFDRARAIVASLGENTRDAREVAELQADPGATIILAAPQTQGQQGVGLHCVHAVAEGVCACVRACLCSWLGGSVRACTCVWVRAWGQHSCSCLCGRRICMARAAASDAMRTHVHARARTHTHTHTHAHTHLSCPLAHSLHVLTHLLAGEPQLVSGHPHRFFQ